MKKTNFWLLVLFAALLFQCDQKKETNPEKKAETVIPVEFPTELIDFVPYEHNPVFAGGGADTWDKLIRERGYILRENGIYRMWYTGYNDSLSDARYLGYATSGDGLHWIRYPGNPLFSDSWVEDMQVIKHQGVYYMFAEGRNDIAHWMMSDDGIHWKNQGNLDIRNTSGAPLSPGPYGTPTVWIEDGRWYLFYERNDQGVWLAESADGRLWKNVQDDPVIAMGPEAYDKHGLAVNQIVKYKGRYYAYYHGTGFDPWRDWTTDVAMSTDLTHWKKYPGNPIVSGDKSSGILVNDGTQYRLYTMHPDVRVYFPAKSKK